MMHPNEYQIQATRRADMMHTAEKANQATQKSNRVLSRIMNRQAEKASATETSLTATDLQTQSA